MNSVSIRDLRNHGGDVVDRVEQGEAIHVTRDGRAVAELRPLDGPRLSISVVLARFRNLPKIDLTNFRRDIDDAIDTSL